MDDLSNRKFIKVCYHCTYHRFLLIGIHPSFAEALHSRVPIPPCEEISQHSLVKTKYSWRTGLHKEAIVKLMTLRL